MFVNQWLNAARRIMYGNLLPIFPTATLDDDRLDGTTYIGIWDVGPMKIKTECSHIFTDKANVIIMGLTENEKTS